MDHRLVSRISYAIPFIVDLNQLLLPDYEFPQNLPRLNNITGNICFVSRASHEGRAGRTGRASREVHGKSKICYKGRLEAFDVNNHG